MTTPYISPRGIRWGDTLVDSNEDPIWTALWDSTLVTGRNGRPAISVRVDRIDGTTGTEVWDAADGTLYAILEADPGGGRILIAA